MQISEWIAPNRTLCYSRRVGVFVVPPVVEEFDDWLIGRRYDLPLFVKTCDNRHSRYRVSIITELAQLLVHRFNEVIYQIIPNIGKIPHSVIELVN